VDCNLGGEGRAALTTTNYNNLSDCSSSSDIKNSIIDHVTSFIVNEIPSWNNSHLSACFMMDP
jgi:hypothetical protein